MVPKLLEVSSTTTVTKKITYRYVGEPAQTSGRARPRKKNPARKKR